MKVVELGAGSVAAALAGMLLADNGATVIKVEPPDGDRLRASAPSGALVWDRGKRGLVADLRTPAGVDRVLPLLHGADAVVEALAPGRAASWGVGYADVRADNPGVVWCSITGFGSSGPYAAIPGYDGVVAAKSGFWDLGELGPGPGPTFNGVPTASTAAAHLAVGGVLAALIARRRTGRGQHVEATLLQGLSVFDYYGTAAWQRQRPPGGGPSGASERATVRPASRPFTWAATADGCWICCTHMTPREARAFTSALGLGDLLDDPRFAGVPAFATAADAEAWDVAVATALRTQPYEAWEPVLLADPDIAFERVRRGAEALDHPQLRHGGGRVVVEHPEVGPVEQVGPVATFSRTPARVGSPAPRVGELAEPPVWQPTALVAEGTTLDHPLSGTTIVELGVFYPAPYAVTLAAALGARVIKLEGPAGDPMRSAFGLPAISAAKTMEGKESLAVDLATPEGADIARRLLARADVVVNGFRPGSAARLGLGEAAALAANPDVLYVHASGYGLDGPYAERRTFSRTASSLAGLVHRHAGPWLEPERVLAVGPAEAAATIVPHVRGPVDGDGNAALALFTTILLGLHERSVSGRGQVATTTMALSNVLANADDACRHHGQRPTPLPDLGHHGFNALHRLYRAAEGWVFLAASGQRDFERLAEALGRPGLAADPRFLTTGARTAHDAALVAELAAVFVGRPAADWESLLVPWGVACVAAFDGSHSAFTCTDPVLRATGLVVEVDHPELGPLLRHGAPVELSETPARLAPGCRMGQHTRPILAELGYSPVEVDALEAAGVVGSEDRPRRDR